MSNFWNHLMRKSSFLFSSKEEDDAEVFTESNEQIGATNTEVISKSFPMTGNYAITDQHMEEQEPFTATFDEVEHNQKQSNDALTAYFDKKMKNNEDHQEVLMANFAKGHDKVEHNLKKSNDALTANFDKVKNSNEDDQEVGLRTEFFFASVRSIGPKVPLRPSRTDGPKIRMFCTKIIRTYPT
jgi:hypothetical protein